METNGNHWDSERHETQRDYWILMRLTERDSWGSESLLDNYEQWGLMKFRETNGDQWGLMRLRETNETHRDLWSHIRPMGTQSGDSGYSWDSDRPMERGSERMENYETNGDSWESETNGDQWGLMRLRDQWRLMKLRETNENNEDSRDSERPLGTH